MTAAPAAPEEMMSAAEALEKINPAASPPPHTAVTALADKKRRARIRRRRIPPELVEEILLYLPSKSVLRFSSVSRSWNSIIAGSWFAGSYGGRKMLVLKPCGGGHLRDALVSPLSSVSPGKPLGDGTPLVPPFEGRPHLVASCDEMWCVQVRNSLILWNPSFQAYRKLPDPWLPPWSKLPPWSVCFRYGLGYDSIADDYKVLKICTYKLKTNRVEAELYSLKSDSWKKIEPFPERNVLSKFGLFVGGVLHWLVDDGSRSKLVIISFDLSKERYGKVALPHMDPDNLDLDLDLDLIDLKGKLGVCVNHLNIANLVIWVRNGESYAWGKEIEISYGDVMPRNNRLRPFEYYEEDGNLVNAVICLSKSPRIFTYRKSHSQSQLQVEVKDVGHIFNGNANIFNSFMYTGKHCVAGYLAYRS